MQAARSGRAQDGIELLMRELAQEHSGRGRFHRKVQLSQLCVSTGHENIALPILQELAAEIERRKLEDWESPIWSHARWRCCTSVSARAATTPASG